MILNISAYRFVRLDPISELKRQILAQTQAYELKGTVLLASEGINLFLAGPPSNMHGFLDWLRLDPRLHDLQAKESWSEHLPFGKLLVKEKREIIRMNEPCIAPDRARAPTVDAPTLARWLDQGHDDAGREVVTLDTRNEFEVKQGQFKNAHTLGLQKFSEFPSAVSAQQGAFEGKTVVSYCTGGIRCEKAVLFMHTLGLQNVLQLEGGILKYFEHTDGRHFEGQCFVFDERVAVDAQLNPLIQP